MLPVSGAAQLVAYTSTQVSTIHLPNHHARKGGQTYLASRPALSKVLSHKTILQVAEPSTLLEMVLWQEHIPQTQCLCLLLQVLDDAGMRREALLGGLANLAEVDFIGGDAFLFDEFLDLAERDGLERSELTERGG